MCSRQSVGLHIGCGDTNGNYFYTRVGVHMVVTTKKPILKTVQKLPQTLEWSKQSSSEDNTKLKRGDELKFKAVRLVRGKSQGIRVLRSAIRSHVRLIRLKKETCMRVV